MGKKHQNSAYLTNPTPPQNPPGLQREKAPTLTASTFQLEEVIEEDDGDWEMFKSAFSGVDEVWTNCFYV